MSLLGRAPFTLQQACRFSTLRSSRWSSRGSWQLGGSVRLCEALGVRQRKQPFRTCATARDISKEYVVVGGGNSAGYAAKAFVDHGQADGKLLIVGAEAVAPYERPTLTKAYLFPPDAKAARLPNFHTTVGGGGPKQTPEWYAEHGIEFVPSTTVTALDTGGKTLTMEGGGTIKYGKLIIATGSTASRLPDKVGGGLKNVEYIRNVADADSLVAALGGAGKVVIVGGGYIGMEVAAAATAWDVDTTLVFPEDHVMPRLFTPAIARHYHELYEKKGVKFITGAKTKRLVGDGSGKVAKVELEDGKVLDADVVVVGIGAKPVVQAFLEAGLEEEQRGIKVDGHFRTAAPDVFAIGDVAAFPLKIYDRLARVEHVDHARKSGQHCVASLLGGGSSEPYDYLPYFYSRVFEYPGSDRKVWWQFYGDNVGESVLVGNFDPKLANFWIDNGKLKGVFLESGSTEEFALLPKLARGQPAVDAKELSEVSTVEEALQLLEARLGSPATANA